MNIKIPDNYWTGSKTMEYEIPWQTPESIFFLDKLCTKNDIVLDIGTGGSTLFYARRCSKVIAIETNPRWHKIVNGELVKRNITNVEYILCDPKLLVDKLESFPNNYFTIMSVDSADGFSRSLFFEKALAKNKGSQLRTIVLDNYGNKPLFPNHYNKTIEDMQKICSDNNDWTGKDFNDSKWKGFGTRILYLNSALTQ